VPVSGSDLPVVESIADPEVVRFLEDRINAFNEDATGIRDGLDVQAVIRDDDGRIVAGIYGWTWGRTCEVDSLWVADGHRGRGLGTSLLTAVEREAARRGCTQIVLDTHSFQAPEFYRRLGYETVGVLPGYPHGYDHVTLRKDLPGSR
jgi:ribosomal protein S18 acetylase RimI-like enzyme